MFTSWDHGLQGEAGHCSGTVTRGLLVRMHTWRNRRDDATLNGMAMPVESKACLCFTTKRKRMPRPSVDNGALKCVEDSFTDF